MQKITIHDFKSGKLRVLPLTMVIATTIIGIGGIIAYSPKQFSPSEVEQTPEASIPEIKTVTALGRLEPSGEIIQVSVSSSAEGNKIEELLVREGEAVNRGQVIAVLDSRDRAEAALRQAEARVIVAQANLARVKAGAQTGEIEAQRATIARLEAERSNNIAAQNAMVSRMEAELRNAQIEYQRYQQLHSQGAISASEKDNKLLILETAKEQLAEAKANLSRIYTAQQKQIIEAKATLDKIAEVRPVDVEVATAEVREAQTAVATAQADLDRAYIKSPQAGTITKILTRPGEVVSSEEGIVRIGQINQMYAIAEVYESDIGKVKLGQKATVTSSAISTELTGTVEHIGLEIERQQVVNTDPTANIDAKVVEVEVMLDKESSQKVAGLTNLLVNVRIDISGEVGAQGLRPSSE
ncbi:MAG: ABC exporter membrane fusion protein [Xenococcaceae cyanobacterium MO_188.B29]|nr:ABC exporter membrane fusion protein [Xenococcaceae cyanobacterium MO_188.B29]